MKRLALAAALALTALALTACNSGPDPRDAKSAGAATGSPAPTAQPAQPQTAQPQPAVIDKPAPDFTLNDYEGKPVHLGDLKGKIVVLEWFNPDCPFVKASHNKGSLKGMAKRWTDKGVVWLAINSGAPGKQGHAPERVALGKKDFAMEHPILADEAGKVGRLYGATNTPHMYVIDAAGNLVYKGAIDNSPDGEGDSPAGGKLVNHVEEALSDLTAKRAVGVKETKAYGCSVKYGS